MTSHDFYRSRTYRYSDTPTSTVLNLNNFYLRYPCELLKFDIKLSFSFFLWHALLPSSALFKFQWGIGPLFWKERVSRWMAVSDSIMHFSGVLPTHLCLPASQSLAFTQKAEWSKRRLLPAAFLMLMQTQHDIEQKSCIWGLFATAVHRQCWNWVLWCH